MEVQKKKFFFPLPPDYFSYAWSKFTISCCAECSTGHRLDMRAPRTFHFPPSRALTRAADPEDEMKRQIDWKVHSGLIQVEFHRSSWRV